jgi:hypothetical protein
MLSRGRQRQVKRLTPVRRRGLPVVKNDRNIASGRQAGFVVEALREPGHSGKRDSFGSWPPLATPAALFAFARSPPMSVADASGDPPGTTFTTKVGAARLGGDSKGLAPFETAILDSESGSKLFITATPARHGGVSNPRAKAQTAES